MRMIFMQMLAQFIFMVLLLTPKVRGQNPISADLDYLTIVSPPSMFHTQNFFGIDGLLSYTIDWKFDLHKWETNNPTTDSELATKPQVCIEVLTAVLNSTSVVPAVIENPSLLIPLRCIQPLLFKPFATQSLQLHGLRDGHSYQVFFYVRRTNLRSIGSLLSSTYRNGDLAALKSVGTGVLELHSSRVLTARAIWPSRLPQISLGAKLEVVLQPHETSTNINVEYYLSILTQSPKFPVAPVGLSHFEVCSTLQLRQRSADGDQSEERYINITHACLPPGDGPRFGLSLGAIQPNEEPYRLVFQTQLSPLGLSERPWPTGAPRVGALGSAERNGVEQSEPFIFPLVVQSLLQNFPRAVTTQPLLELMAEVPRAVTEADGSTHNTLTSAVVDVPISFKSESGAALKAARQCMTIIQLAGTGQSNFSIAEQWGVSQVQTVLDDAALFNATAALEALSSDYRATDVSTQPPAPKPILFVPSTPTLVTVTCAEMLNAEGQTTKFTIAGLQPGM